MLELRERLRDEGREVGMFGLGWTEVGIIAVVILLLSGGSALPFIAGYFIGKNRGERTSAEGCDGRGSSEQAIDVETHHDEDAG
jgi:Sec-independent protein translocase protein TatA